MARFMCRASHESQTVREILQELENGAQGINKGIGSFLLSLLKKSCAPFSSSWRISRTVCDSWLARHINRAMHRASAGRATLATRFLVADDGPAESYSAT
jgi:hypothetical protein